MKRIQRVQAALAGGEWLTGLDLWRRCGLMPGTTYPILHRLRRRGLVQRREEPHPDGGIRVYYRANDA